MPALMEVGVISSLLFAAFFIAESLLQEASQAHVDGAHGVNCNRFLSECVLLKNGLMGWQKSR